MMEGQGLNTNGSFTSGAVIAICALKLTGLYDVPLWLLAICLVASSLDYYWTIRKRTTMATPAMKYDETFKQLSRLLMDAAGIPEDKRMYITSITCRCAANEVVRFTIEKFGDTEDIEKAIAK